MHKAFYDIVLINPKPMLSHSVKAPNVGLCTIEAYLAKHGYRCCIISLSEIDRYIEKSEVFGISVLDQSYREAQVLTRKLKNKTVIWGGWTATAVPEYILNENKGVDYVVMQEGEYRLNQLLPEFCT